MKNVIQKATLVLGVVLLAFTACKKQDMEKVVGSTTETDLIALVDQAGSDMLIEEANDVTPDEGVALIDEGISADFLVVAADLDETEGPNGLDDKQRNHVRSHSFIACLRKVELSERQQMAIKKALANYENCKESAVKRARAIHAKLVAAYKEKFERLQKAFRNGDLTEKEYKEAVHRLRMAFNKELRSLQLHEKLDAAFKNCYKEFLGNVKNILTEKQWAAFVECHKR